MPMHEYWCDDCEWEGDRIVSHDDRDDQLCLKCGGPLLRSEINKSTRFILKGPRWARDGYSSKKEK